MQTSYRRDPIFAFIKYPRDYGNLGLDSPLISLLRNHIQLGCVNLDSTFEVFIIGDLFIHLEIGILDSSQDVLQETSALPGS